MTVLAAATNATQPYKENGMLSPGTRATPFSRCFAPVHEPMGSLMGFFVVVACVTGASVSTTRAWFSV